MSNKFDEIMTLRAELEAKLQEFGQEAFTEGFAPFFAANPHVDGVIWTQYTPYFNDGDACEFGVNDPAVILSLAVARAVRPDRDWSEYSTTPRSGNMADELTPDQLRALADAKESGVDSLPEDESFDYDNPRRFDSWDLRSTEYTFERMGFDKVWGRIPEEVFKSVFGDHVEVLIRRDGTVIVEEYEHD